MTYHFNLNNSELVDRYAKACLSCLDPNVNNIDRLFRRYANREAIKAEIFARFKNAQSAAQLLEGYRWAAITHADAVRMQLDAEFIEQSKARAQELKQKFMLACG